jgi:uncharacterized protein
MPEFHPAIKMTLDHFVLKDRGSIHGVDHWGRVLENGLRLAPLTGADPLVVSLFAIFHDCKRLCDGRDIHHGPRAAKFVYEVAGYHLKLDGTQTILLAQAVAGHTNRFRSTNPTLATCWDADRLDIPRIGHGTEINPFFLSTKAAKDPEILAWAQERAENVLLPDFVTPYL